MGGKRARHRAVRRGLFAGRGTGEGRYGRGGPAPGGLAPGVPGRGGSPGRGPRRPLRGAMVAAASCVVLAGA
ncbi:hypothetical protein [Streptomyces sp. DfronAA-171]|uniref:hypothetical protein n=1 Tax=Streptomyces sp. DfronAA-171 TaxID=1839777 RepID=UPI00081DE64C|nr:hypothetical protein [Streptomyces sp. DfronAA-171]SCE50119.1 hypothetical protein GA0115252_154717 [Streptomyces sp. DfronAA-171]